MIDDRFVGTAVIEQELKQEIACSSPNVLLIEKALAGDHTAFVDLVSKYHSKIYSTLYAIVHNQDDALDLLQDTFIKTYQSLHKLKNRDFFCCWMHRIAINLATNFINKRKRLQRYKEKQIQNNKRQHCYPPYYYLERQEIQNFLRELIAQLPPKQRNVLVLCDIEEYSYKQIAAILDCNIGTVMSRLFYARDKLRQALLQAGYFG